VYLNVASTSPLPCACQDLVINVEEDSAGSFAAEVPSPARAEPPENNKNAKHKEITDIFIIFTPLMLLELRL